MLVNFTHSVAITYIITSVFIEKGIRNWLESLPKLEYPTPIPPPQTES